MALDGPSAVQTQTVRYSQNRAGVNFGETECTVNSIEFSDMDNIDLKPINGFRVRPGTEKFYTHASIIQAISVWDNPSGQREDLYIDENGYFLRRIGLWRDLSGESFIALTTGDIFAGGATI